MMDAHKHMEMHRKHEGEREQMHHRHHQAHGDMHARHSAERKQMNQRHENEMLAMAASQAANNMQQQPPGEGDQGSLMSQPPAAQPAAGAAPAAPGGQ